MAFFVYWAIMMYTELRNQFRSKLKRVYLFLCLCGNTERLKGELEQQAIEDKSDILYERYAKAIIVFERLYKSGRLVLNDNLIERIEHYCDEDVFLGEIGILSREKQELIRVKARMHSREQRFKQFHKNVEKSFMTQEPKKELET